MYRHDPQVSPPVQQSLPGFFLHESRVCHIASSQHWVIATLMPAPLLPCLCSIPNKYNQAQMLSILEKSGFRCAALRYQQSNAALSPAVVGHLATLLTPPPTCPARPHPAAAASTSSTCPSTSETAATWVRGLRGVCAVAVGVSLGRSSSHAACHCDLPEF